MISYFLPNFWFSNPHFSLFGCATWCCLNFFMIFFSFYPSTPEGPWTWGPCWCCSWSSPPSSPTRKAWKAWACSTPSRSRTSVPPGPASRAPPSHCSRSYSSLLSPRLRPVPPFHLVQVQAWGFSAQAPPSLGPAAPPGRRALPAPAVTVRQITPHPTDEKRKRRRRRRGTGSKKFLDGIGGWGVGYMQKRIEV